MKTLDEIPKEDLIDMLKERAWYCSPTRPNMDGHHGYSLDVQEETCYRDVLYRDEPLFKTVEEAILEHWKRHYRKVGA